MLISLCLIVRDEQELLPGCLQSVRGLWDQLCVVDTGSTDATVAIAQEAGAEVIHHPWSDDFAAARNVGLAEARGDFIVFLDADERACPEAIAQWRAAAADATVGAATVVMRNRLPNGHVREMPLLRAFRRDPSIRFRHAIHEEIVTDVSAYLVRTGRRMVHLPAVIEHLGYQRERAVAKNKRERDVRILRGCVERDPADLYSWFKLAEAARFWSDGPLLGEVANAVCQHLQGQGVAGLKLAPWGGELLVLVAQGLAADDPAGNLAVLERWAASVPASAALQYRLGELRERKGDAAGATAAFNGCLELQHVTADRQLATVRPRMGLARLALARNDLPLAWSHVQQALHVNHRDPEALLCAAVVQQAQAGSAGLEQFVGAYVGLHGRTVELQATLREIGASPRP